MNLKNIFKVILKFFKFGLIRSVSMPSWLLPSMLFLACHGAFWSRGGYSDDFAFLGLVTEQGVFNTIINWSFNSRWGQALSLPLIFKTITLISPDHASWWMIHLLGVVSFVVILILMNSISKRLGLNKSARIIGLSIFAVHPLKAQAILWPSTIVGYVLPVLAFLAGVHISQCEQKKMLNPPISFILVCLLFIFASLSIEQLLPVIIVVNLLFALRDIVNKRMPYYPLLLMIIVTSIFVIGTFGSGKTSARLNHFILSNENLFIHSISILFGSIKETIIYPLRFILDPYWFRNYFSKIWLLLTPFILFIIYYLLQDIVRRWALNKGNLTKNFMSINLCFFCMILWTASWAPFFIIKYEIPPRAQFIPLIFLSLVLGIILDKFGSYKKINFAKNLTILIVLTIWVVGTSSSLFAEKDFHENWGRVSKLESKIKKLNLEKPDIKKVDVVGIPKAVGPSPGFINEYSISGMLTWMNPSGKINGSTTEDIINVLPFLNNNRKDYTADSGGGHYLIIWSEKLSEFKIIEYVKSNTFDNNALKHIEPSILTESYLEKPNMHITINRHTINKDIISKKAFVCKIDSVYTVEELDVGILSLTLLKNTEPLKQKILIHAIDKNGYKENYDLRLSKNTDDDNKPLKKSALIQNFQEVEVIKIGIKDSHLFSQRDKTISFDTKISYKNNSIKIIIM